MRFPEPGEVIAGRFEIQGILGEGGFSRGYLAVQAELGRRVALKVLKPGEAPSGASDAARSEFNRVTQRFLQEARLISRLRDPCTVTMFDYGETDSGLLYMALEYVDGVTIQAMRKDLPLEPRRTVHIIRQILGSLQEAHVFGVLHRDIKPANIIVYDHAGRVDQVKVVDFGIAKVLEREIDRPITVVDMTGEDVLVGTPRYMSPEQIRGEKLTPASDIYSIGLVAYELAMGARAIDTDSSVSIIGRHLDREPIVLPLDAQVPDQLRFVIDTMLEKDIKRRYASCDEILADLEDWKLEEAGTEPSMKVPEVSREMLAGTDFDPIGSAQTSLYRPVDDSDLATRTTAPPEEEIPTVPDRPRPNQGQPADLSPAPDAADFTTPPVAAADPSQERYEASTTSEESSDRSTIFIAAIGILVLMIVVLTGALLMQLRSDDVTTKASPEVISLSNDPPAEGSDEAPQEPAQIEDDAPIKHVETTVVVIGDGVVENAREVASNRRDVLDSGDSKEADEASVSTRSEASSRERTRAPKKSARASQKKSSRDRKRERARASSSSDRSGQSEEKNNAKKDGPENELGIFGIE